MSIRHERPTVADIKASSYADARKREADDNPMPDLNSLEIGEGELERANPAPRCIVDGYLYADLSLLVAPGGAGKTTIMLYEMIHIATGRDLWGSKVVNPGVCILVTAEDSREMCLSRLYRLMRELKQPLSEAEVRLIRERILIWDVSGKATKLVETIKDIELTGLPDHIVDRCRGESIAMIVFDPLVSFGASEAKVNDNEQALVLAARAISRGIDCCVRYIHHTGQEAARNRTSDQYTGRGGSALPDGARMVNVMQSADPGEKARLADVNDDDDVTVFSMPKLSYAKKPGRMFIVRSGWKIKHQFEQPQLSEQEQLDSRKRQMMKFIDSKLAQGIKLSKTNIKEGYRAEINMTKAQVVEAVDQLQTEGLLQDSDLPKDEQQGRRKTYLKPIRPEPRTSAAE